MVVACWTSRSSVTPPRKRLVAICRPSSCTFTLSVGDPELLLEGAQIDVGRGEVGGQADQDVVVVGDTGGQLGVRGFDRAAELAPEVELPGGLHRRRVPSVYSSSEALTLRGERVAGTLPRPLERAHRLLGLRVLLADRGGQLRSRLQYPGTRHLQRQVLRVADLDQPVQRRIVECAATTRRCWQDPRRPATRRS